MRHPWGPLTLAVAHNRFGEATHNGLVDRGLLDELIVLALNRRVETLTFLLVAAQLGRVGDLDTPLMVYLFFGDYIVA